MKTINYNAPVKCSKSISIATQASIVWEVLTNINQWPAWQTAIATASLKGTVAVGSSFNWKTGGANIQSIIHTVEPYQFFGWTGKTMGMYAIHNWTITEHNGITTVTVDESMEGFLARLFRKAFNKSLEKGMTEWLQLLQQQCEKL